MKKAILMIPITLIVLLTGCITSLPDEVNPFAKTNSTWISDDNSISFVIEDTTDAKGTILHEGNTYQCTVNTGVDHYINFHNSHNSQEVVVRFYCNYKKNNEFDAYVASSTIFRKWKKFKFHRADS